MIWRQSRSVAWLAFTSLFENPASVRGELEKLVNDWDQADAKDEDGEGESEAPRKSLPDKKKKRLLSEATWKRDAMLVDAASWRVEDAPPVVKKLHKPGKTRPDPLRGLFEAEVDGQAWVVEYQPDSELRDYEQVPLLEPGGVEGFIRREVLPYTPDAWIFEADTKIGYEISFTRHFYKPPELRTLAQISADILALEQETEGLLGEITKGAGG